MPSHILEKIRNTIRLGNYDLTQHAISEMAEDELGIADVENAVLHGDLTKTETDDPRGIRYTVRGWSADQQIEIGVVGRFTDTDVYLIITAYEVIDEEA